VDEMNLLIVDPGDVLGEGVRAAVESLPVEIVLPVSAEVDQKVEPGPVVPVRTVDLVGPSGASETTLQVVDLGLGDHYDEWFDFKGHHASKARDE
jgi:hypothetical protein